jgi:hypothetical protein
MIPGVAQPALDAPVEPGVEQARRWLLDELARPVYQAAEPTWFDRLSKAIGDWIAGLFTGGGGSGGILPLIGLIGVVALLVVALLVYGMPRLNRRARSTTMLFGDADARTAAQMRRAAGAAAASGDWSSAIIERFRAIARTASDRTVVSIHPGTTADDFARRAGVAYPGAASRLVDAARAFDAVRYLGAPGTAAEYDSIAALDDELAEAKVIAS